MIGNFGDCHPGTSFEKTFDSEQARDAHKHVCLGRSRPKPAKQLAAPNNRHSVHWYVSIAHHEPKLDAGLTPRQALRALPFTKV